MRNSGTQSPSEGARGEGSVTEPTESGSLMQGAPRQEFWSWEQRRREQVGHKCSSLPLLQLLPGPRWPTPEGLQQTQKLPSAGVSLPEQDGEKRHYLHNVGKYTITHWPLYSHSEPHCTDPETEALQVQAAWPYLHSGAGISLRQTGTPSLILASQLGPSR